MVSLIDEADYFLIDKKEFKPAGSAQFIGLTATTMKKSSFVEKRYLKDTLKVKIYKS